MESIQAAINRSVDGSCQTRNILARMNVTDSKTQCLLGCSTSHTRCAGRQTAITSYLGPFNEQTCRLHSRYWASMTVKIAIAGNGYIGVPVVGSAEFLVFCLVRVSAVAATMATNTLPATGSLTCLESPNQTICASARENRYVS